MECLTRFVTDYVQNFEWQRGATPLSSPYAVAAGVAAYLGMVFAIKAVVKKPVQIPSWVPALHNLNLCVWSLAMFVGCAWETWKTTQEQGNAVWMVCMPPGTPAKGGLFFWSYSYYLSKYYEFVDTILLALKAKPTSFLHVFHHATVLPMAYLWLETSQSLQQIGLLFNTGIHVLMYWYYFLTCLKIYPWWKKYITSGQIVQFMFSFLVSIPFWYICLTSGRAPADTCAGWSAMLFNAAFNALLLGLFINFHRKTYRTTKAGTRGTAAGGSKAKQT